MQENTFLQEKRDMKMPSKVVLISSNGLFCNENILQISLDIIS